MLTELKKSLNAILYERVASPFYGTFIISWMVWNWKIIYLTLFINQTAIQGNKIDYIISYYFDWKNLWMYPLFSTIILLTLFPFITNGAYWLALKFKMWRIDTKHKLERKQPITIGESIALRETIRQQEERTDLLLKGKEQEIKMKDEEIAILRQEIEKLKDNITASPVLKSTEYPDSKTEYKNFKNNTDMFLAFETVIKACNQNVNFMDSINMKFKDNAEKIHSYYLVNNIIDKIVNSRACQLTEKGKIFAKIFFDEKLDKE